MALISRRAVLALGTAICCPTHSFAASIEPILRNPVVLIADLGVTWASDEPEQLWPALAEILSSEVHSILRDEVHNANSPLIVLSRPIVMPEDPYRHSPLYVKVGMKLKAVSGAKPTLGTVSLSFERLGFETVLFAQPATHFLAANHELLGRSGDAIREQFAAFVGIFAAEEARSPDFVKFSQ